MAGVILITMDYIEAASEGHTNNLSLYGNLGWNVLKNSNISLFGRSDNHKQTGMNKTYKINFNQLFNDLNLGVSYMTGIRNPTIYEMFGTDNFGYSGNKNLQPEKSNNYELYSNIVLNENLNLSSRAFKANIQNHIEYIDNQYRNNTDNVDLHQSGLINQININ